MASAATMTVPGTKRSGDAALQHEQPASKATAWLVPKLLSIAFIVSAGIGVFEVGLALRGKQELGLTPFQIALMFTECSTGDVRRPGDRIFALGQARNDTLVHRTSPRYPGGRTISRSSCFQLCAHACGDWRSGGERRYSLPILTYWISRKAGNAQGAELGKQTAAASLGAAVGSAAGGLLFDVAWLPNASFLLVTLLTALGILLSFGLPSRLVTRKQGKAGADGDGRLPMTKPSSSAKTGRSTA
ncbi:hypothetical protein ACVOMV_26300 (plasmid) [Mesorhizobium atlanticum]|uniref:hypothetical protein n=1 Tax=Mesorhizobium atlanticum TaxID=2233532 RepID=UPI00370405A4